MKEKEEKKLEKNNFWGSILGVMLTAALLVMGIGGVISCILVGVVGAIKEYSFMNLLGNIKTYMQEDFVIFLVSAYASLTIVAIVFVLFLAARHKDVLRTLKPGYKNNKLSTLLIGFAIGFGMNMLGALIAILGGNLSLKFVGMNVGLLLLSFVLLAGQCIAEEIAYRCYAFRMINKRHPAYVAVLFSAVIFAVTHLGNSGVGILAVINIVLIGIFLAETVFYFDNIYLAIGFHTLWNFTQNFILGLPNSGTQAVYSLWGIESQSDSMLYSTAFGIESTLTTTILTIIGIAIVTIIGQKRKNIFAKESICPVIDEK